MVFASTPAILDMADSGTAAAATANKNVVFQDTETTISTDLTSSEPLPTSTGRSRDGLIRAIYVPLVILLLFLNYFLAQYDKFVLSYFQAEVIESLNLTSTQYGILSGYAVGILYAVLAIPMAYIADYTDARVWVLSGAALWWSLCVLFQGLSHNFWQILLARIGMGIGQSPVEAISISLISDLVPLNWIFVCERYVSTQANMDHHLPRSLHGLTFWLQHLLHWRICRRGRQRPNSHCF